ncbi:MAG: dTDP-4-dehydrorhamnose 3,5-epimerase [Haliscomenobacter sp.]|uniref:dTDP-4-dehydrorhamnose 3,5-epimerase n=1 Tax=Haliscomenobacter sp. TaxID=2717303 RepID=UPI0029BED1D3|nr:dTDP-4-dehydrorhamnose 3,5-epimerase [Haliscomenobacter sp.]MDX2072282.1 dTDP-4-dehydrorhamnose 3,5-epimerase [Haliscomenobacter sp.]
MVFHKTALEGAYIIDLEPFSDDRGLFARTFCKREFSAIGHNKEFVQFNHSHSNQQGTLRGLHFQRPPHAEIKLIRCIRGSVFDVIVDLRHGSATFLHYVGVELSEQNMRMIYVPEGFAHGFQTLADHCELIYHHTAFYAPNADGGIRYDDPKINIAWPLEISTISEKDKNLPLLSEDFAGMTL